MCVNECKAYAGAARAVLPTLLAVLGLAMSPAASADSDAEQIGRAHV